MHQDQRIGLALGVLLVGACAALFFRNETRTLSDVPRLKNARDLDDRIAERSNRPYRKGIEAVEDADRRRSDGLDVQNESSAEVIVARKRSTSWDPFSLFNRGGVKDASALSSTAPSSTAPSNALVQHSPVSPSPVELDGRLADVEAGHRPEQLTATAPNGHVDEPSSKENRGQIDTRSYVVQSGESLSSIAAKELGDRTRYPEIFEANLDQLNDPNDVKFGMILRIPDLDQRRAAFASNPRARSTSSHPGTRLERLASNDDHHEIRKIHPQADLKEARTDHKAGGSKLTTMEPKRIPLPVDVPVTVHIEPPIGAATRVEENGSSKKFIRAKRTPLQPMIGPQTQIDEKARLGTRKLSQISQESSLRKTAQ